MFSDDVTAEEHSRTQSSSIQATKTSFGERHGAGVAGGAGESDIPAVEFHSDTSDIEQALLQVNYNVIC